MTIPDRESVGGGYTGVEWLNELPSYMDSLSG